MEWIAVGFILMAVLYAQAVLTKKARTRANIVARELVRNLEDLFYECIYPGYASGAIRFRGFTLRRRIVAGPWFIFILVSYREDVHVNVEDIVFQRLLRLMRDRYLEEEVLVKPFFIKRRATDGRTASSRGGAQGESGRPDRASSGA